MSRHTKWIAAPAGVGFLLGAFVFPTWPDVVEQGMLIAGLIEYPVKTPAYHFATQTWWILPQILGIFLKLGVSEWMLCRFVSGLLGAVSFSAVAMAALAFSRDPLVSAIAPLFVFASGAYQHGATYQIYMLGVGSTSGILADSTMLLVPSLIALGELRASAFLLGLAPCLHPVMGAFLWLFTGLSVLGESSESRRRMLANAGPFLLGLAVSSASLAFQLAVIRDPPAPADPAAIDELFRSFIRHWDFHRSPYPMLSSAIFIAGASVAACSALIAFRDRLLPVGADFLCRVVIISGLISAGFAAATHLPVEAMPKILLLLMPQRFLNLAVFIFAPLALGAVAWLRHSRRGQDALFVLLGLFGLRLLGWIDLYVFLSMIAITLFIDLALHAGRNAAGASRIEPAQGRWARAKLMSFAQAAAILALVVGAVRALPASVTISREDFSRDFFRSMSERDGLVATAPGISFIPLRTRRPILIDSVGLDHLPYAGSTGPLLNDVLREFYGVDILAPPPGLVPSGQIPVEPTRSLWESRTSGEWSSVAVRRGVRDILTPSNWDLKIPVVAENEYYALFRIPGVADTAPLPIRSRFVVARSIDLAKADSPVLASAGLEAVLSRDPNHGHALVSLALLRQSQGDVSEAVPFYRRAALTWPDWPTAAGDAANNLAWILATSDSAALRNGDEAVALADRASRFAGNSDPVRLDTLGAAYAEAGDFRRAVSTALLARERARAVGVADLADAISKRLELYRVERPYRE